MLLYGLIISMRFCYFINIRPRIKLGLCYIKDVQTWEKTLQNKPLLRISWSINLINTMLPFLYLTFFAWFLPTILRFSSTQWNFENACCLNNAGINGQMIQQEQWLWFLYFHWMNRVGSRNFKSRGVVEYLGSGDCLDIQ